MSDLLFKDQAVCRGRNFPVTNLACVLGTHKHYVMIALFINKHMFAGFLLLNGCHMCQYKYF